MKFEEMDAGIFYEACRHLANFQKYRDGSKVSSNAVSEAGRIARHMLLLWQEKSGFSDDERMRHYERMGLGEDCPSEAENPRLMAQGERIRQLMADLASEKEQREQLAAQLNAWHLEVSICTTAMGGFLWNARDGFDEEEGAMAHVLKERLLDLVEHDPACGEGLPSGALFWDATGLAPCQARGSYHAWLAGSQF
jgi:hypothetical protein